MLYLIIILIVLYLIQHVFVIPDLFKIPQDLSQVKADTKKQKISIVVVVALLLLCVFFMDFRYYDSGHIWSQMSLTGILILSLYTCLGLFNKSERVVNRYENLRTLKHGDKDEIEKQKAQLNKEKIEFKQIQNLLSKRSQKLDKLEHSLKEEKIELNNKSQNVKTMKANTLSSIKEEVSKRKVVLENEYHEKLINEKNLLQENYNRKLSDYTERLTVKMENRIKAEKSDMVGNLFQFDGINDDDFFEITKAKEEIEKSKLLLAMEEKVMSAKQYEMDAKRSALEIKSDMKVMASEFKMDLLTEHTERLRGYDNLLHMLEMEHQKRQLDSMDIKHHIEIMQERNKTKFMDLKHYFENELKNVQMETNETFRQVKENMSDMKLQFGKEILRLDGQQQNILVELEKYYLKSREYVHQCQSLALEAKNQNIEGGKLLSQVNTLYKEHRYETKDMERQMNLSLEKISVQEGKFANHIGETYLNLQNAVNNNHFILKDIALERKGIDIAYQTKEKDHEMNLKEIQYQKKDLDRAGQIFKLEQQNDKDKRSSDNTIDRMNYNMQRDRQHYAQSIEKAEKSHRYLNKVISGD